MLRIHEEAGNPPQLARGDRRGHFSVRPSRIDSGEFLLRTVLTATDRCVAFVHVDRGCAPLADRRSFVHPATLRPILTRRPASKGHSAVIEERPTPALFGR